MATALIFPYTSGLTLYAVRFNTVGQIYNTVTLLYETPQAANWAHYVYALSEQGGTGLYLGSFPADTYDVLAYQQLGGAAAPTDLVVAEYEDPLAAVVPGSYPSSTAGAVLGAVSGVPQITLTSPVTQAGNINILQGDTYYAADGRAIAFTDAGGTWPNLTGATLALNIYTTNRIIYTHAMTCTNPGATHQTVQLELSATDSAQVPSGPFRVVATLSDGHAVTLVDAVCTSSLY